MQRINSMKHTYLVLLIPFLAGNLQATVFTIDTTADSGAGSLRDAISNLVAGSNTIQFDIPTTDSGYDAANGTWTISPASDLPVISEPVTISGYGFFDAVYNTATPNNLGIGDDAVLQIIINGSNYTVGDGASTGNGLHFGAGSDGSIVTGLVINEWLLNGILIDGTDATINGIQINGNFIGTNAAGTAVDANRCGIGISGAVNPITNTIIGTPAFADRNIIAGSFGYMILDNYNIRGAGICGYGNSGTLIQNNYIGTDISGTLALGLSQVGILFMFETDGMIGGPSNTQRNIISGQQLFGINFNGITFVTFLNPAPGCSGCTVQGNYIGTDVRGAIALGNENAGIAIDSNAVFNTFVGNVISGNRVGMRLGQFNLPGTEGNTIQSNFIGTDPSGRFAIPNTNFGIIANHSESTIEDNVISGNGSGGILIYGVNGLYAPGVTSSAMTNNYIGTDITGTRLIPNGGNGIQLGVNGTTFCSATNNIIGS